ncbi:MAG: FAD-binding oxidoreductase [Gammaproteobacteria bacterium]|nr:FAD-binding oxidoreductase [Gammaproteobacteria bacterium]
MTTAQSPDHQSSPHVASWYAATAHRSTLRPALNGAVDAEVCVVGGGYSGLSTALALAERGVDVVLVEAKAIGWGASGRNGGQVVNGLNAGLDRIERRFGREAADFVGRHVQEGARIIAERIERYRIDCDYRPGNLYAACTRAQLEGLAAKQTLWRRYGMDDHELLDRDAMREHVASDFYVGGMIDHSGGHLHPLNLALGEADAIEQLGGRVFEASPVTRLESKDHGHQVHTEQGSVSARHVVLCGNAYMVGVAPELENRIMPVSTQIVTTAPLGAARAQALLPTNLCVEDARYVLDYYRLTADHRLLFGGGIGYGGTDPSDIRARLRGNLEQVFPQLRGVELEYAWSGNFALSFSRVPQMGRLREGVYFAHGYSGHGVTGSHLFGVILAEAITGDSRRFDVFAALPYQPFPGGRALRVPYSVAGAWWYGLRDRLGI